MTRMNKILAGLALLVTPALPWQSITGKPAGSNAAAATGSTLSAGASGAATATASPSSSDVTFAAEQGSLDLQLRADQTASTWVLVVFNRGDANKSDPPFSPKFYLDMKGSATISPCTVAVAALAGNTSLKPGDRRGIPVTITSCRSNGGEGTLGILGSKGQKQTIEITLKPRRACWLMAAILVSLIGAVVLSGVCARIVVGQGHELRDSMGSASWDFSSSWASNITAFGAGFTFLLQLMVFPDKPFFANKLEYTFCAAFAVALAAFAPAVHRLASVAIGYGPSTKAKLENPALLPNGLVAGFLAASAFTIWGALLQSVVELLILCELVRTTTIYYPIGFIVAFCLVVATVGLLVYCSSTLLSTIAANAARSRTLEHPSFRFGGKALVEAEARKTPISVL